MRLTNSTIVLAVGGCILIVGLVLFGGHWNAVATEELRVFSSEADAAYEGALNRKSGPAISVVKQGETVIVLWDTYGKDYWACYVRTSTNLSGWVLCNSLQRVV